MIPRGGRRTHVAYCARLRIEVPGTLLGPTCIPGQTRSTRVVIRAAGRPSNPMAEAPFGALAPGRVKPALDGMLCWTWPGCNCRGVCTAASSMELSFPADAGADARVALITVWAAPGRLKFLSGLGIPITNLFSIHTRFWIQVRWPLKRLFGVFLVRAGGATAPLHLHGALDFNASFGLYGDLVTHQCNNWIHTTPWHCGTAQRRG